MTIYTLYVKTHRKTGLKYLGQTSQDPFKYPGSGVDWDPHLKEFGDDVNTEILLQTTDKSERNHWGRYFSTLWHIVTAADDFGNKIWANRIPETGGGGGANHGHEPYWNPTEDELLDHGKKSKERWENPEYRERVIKSQQDSWTDDRRAEQVERLSGKKRPEHSDAMKKLWENDELREAASEFFSNMVRTATHKNNIAKSLTGVPKSEEHKKNLKKSWENRKANAKPKFEIDGIPYASIKQASEALGISGYFVKKKITHQF